MVARVGAACLHGRLHPPQCDVSLFGSTQLIPHNIGVGLIQPLTQVPPLQSGVEPEHDVPQPPQVAALERSASQPSLAEPLQSS